MFQDFGKIARLNRECVITEKIDGTNAQVFIEHEAVAETEDCIIRNGPCAELVPTPWIASMDGFRIAAGSRTRYITPENDNHGFAKFVAANVAELMKLGPGRHFGEWWGSGIQGSYGAPKGVKTFSLFNTSRWTAETAPSCCSVVPVLYRGNFKTTAVEDALQYLRTQGSVASPGFMKPEGVIVYHTAANVFFKVTLEKDEQPKSRV